MANLLALDQSSQVTGYARVQEGTLLTAATIECKNSDIGKRLNQLRDALIDIIKKYNINEVVYEDIQLQKINDSETAGIKTYKALAEVIGVVRELLTELHIKHTAVAPIVWKATFKIAGKGRAQEKKLSQAYVAKTYGLSCSEDEADAVCIGAHYLKQQSQVYDWSE